MESQISLLRIHRRLKVIKRQLRTGLCCVLRYHQFENEGASLLFKSRNENLTCYLHFKKLAFNMFLGIDIWLNFQYFSSCASKGCLEIQTVAVVLLQ